MKDTRLGRRHRLLAVLLGGALLATTSPAMAQDDAGEGDAIDLEPVPADQIVGPFKIDDGSYAGSLAFSYSLTRSQSSLTLWLHRAGSGTASFDVADGTMTGDWEHTDSGGLSILEHPGLAEADAVGTASGTLTGSFPYTLGGVYNSDVNATVDAGAVGGLGGVATDSGSDSVELIFELSESVQICGQVQANWDDSFRTQFGELGWESNLKTQLVALPATTDDEIQARVLALIESASHTATQMASDESALVFMIDTLLDAESIMSDIESYPEACPLDAGFLRIVNQIVRDMIHTLLNRWDSQDETAHMIVLRRLTEVGLRSGVIGAGAVDAPSADVIEAKIIELVQQRFDDLMATDGLDEEQLRQAVVVAEMLGHQLADVSNADLCIVLGGC